MNWYLRNGIVINAVLAVLICAGLILFDVPVICVFNKEAELV